MTGQASAKKSLQSERALRELRAHVLSGALPAGAHVSETAAAEMIGISRTPTREALAQLVEEGLMERTSSGRCTVRAFTPADVADAIELRGVLEGTVLRLAAERGADPDSIRACQQIAGKIDGALGDSDAEIDFDLYADLNAAFHDALIRTAASPTLEREVARAYRLPLASPSAFLQGQATRRDVRRSLFVAQAQHRAMLDAVLAREGARAEAIAREHARLAHENLAKLTRGAEKATGFPGLSLVSGPDIRSTKGRIP